VGVTTVTCTAVDNVGNSNSCSFTVTVRLANQPPVAVIQFDPQCDLSPWFPNPTIIANDNSNAVVRFDGTLSSDPDGDPLTYRWAELLMAPFATTAVTSNTFGLGEHTVVLTVNDGQADGTASVTFDVITPCEGVEVLIAIVEQSGLTRKEKRPLIATLKTACAKFEKGRCHEGEQLLKAFKNKVRAQLWRRHRALAEQLIRVTDVLLECIECQKKRKGDEDDDDGGDDDDDDDGGGGGDDDDD
jgi:hypothetical protein